MKSGGGRVRRQREAVGNVSECMICGRPFTSKMSVKYCSMPCNGEALRRLSLQPERIARRFWPRVDKNGPTPKHMPELGPCWLWTASKGHKGYGTFSIAKTAHNAQRAAWFIHYGEWPKGCACHKCDNPACVRPEHLFDGTYQENSDDMFAKGRNRHARGSEAGKAKLTEDQVREIRQRFEDGEGKWELAAEFGVGETTMRKLLQGETWSHVA